MGIILQSEKIAFGVAWSSYEWILSSSFRLQRQRDFRRHEKYADIDRRRNSDEDDCGTARRNRCGIGEFASDPDHARTYRPYRRALGARRAFEDSHLGQCRDG